MTTKHVFKTNSFRVIYVEDQVRELPLTRAILAHNSAAPVVGINRYRDVFDRPRQDQAWQRRQRALILARKEPPYLYPGPPVCQAFGAADFVYAAFLYGCPFHCAYCFLQGLYPSAYPVLFVNPEDTLQAIRNRLARSSALYVAASHDTDLLAWRPLLPITDLILNEIHGLPNLTLELRTKAAQPALLHDLVPSPDWVLAVSLAPQPVIDRYEQGTPSLARRLAFVQHAAERGIRLRLCLDPILAFSESDVRTYESFINTVFRDLIPDSVEAVSLGCFRMPEDFLRRARRRNPDAGLLQRSWPIIDGVAGPPAEFAAWAQSRIIRALRRYISEERIFDV